MRLLWNISLPRNSFPLGSCNISMFLHEWLSQINSINKYVFTTNGVYNGCSVTELMFKVTKTREEFQAFNKTNQRIFQLERVKSSFSF